MTRLNARNAFLIFCLLFLSLLVVVFHAGCGGTAPPDCSVAVGLKVAPQTATADHSAAPPGNQISFVALDMPPASCPPTPGAPRLDLTWSVSDPGNVTIGNTQGVDYGVATCKNASANPATVTAAGTNKLKMPINGTASLTCK
ncbi:MAG TPA: hypothetical protein VJA94_06495 [Candidatus Angelobacter sp.]